MSGPSRCPARKSIQATDEVSRVMGIATTTALHCPYGRRSEVIAFGRAMTALFGRHGVRGTRLFEPISAGVDSEIYLLTNEFPAEEQYGVFADALYADDELTSLMGRLSMPDSPVRFVAQM